MFEKTTGPEKASGNTAANKPETDMTIGLELPRLIERMHRRYLDVIGPALVRNGADDISPVQYMMLLHISNAEISVRELVERGHYIGSNASYNLKQLVERGYVERTASLRDKRSARVKLSEKALTLVVAMRELDRTLTASLYEETGGAEALEVTYKSLRQLESRWRDALHAETADILQFIE